LAQRQILSESRAGTEPIFTREGFPVKQPVIAGVHGTGVGGFMLQTPKGIIFTKGLQSVITARGGPAKTRFDGITLRTPGAAPPVQLSIAPEHTNFDI
jgi:hypothetical protein